MIICEIGLNHCGSKEYADDYLDVLMEKEVDAVTFQIREPGFYLNKEKRKLHLPNDYYREAKNKVEASNKKFGIALSDLTLLDFFESINTDFYKILSKDANNEDFVSTLMAKTKKDVYISTGLSNDQQIEKLSKYSTGLERKISLIHTQLSNRISDVNLLSVKKLKDKYNMPISYGHHCENVHVLYLALVFKPSDLFFYVKGERETVHPDEDHAIKLENISKVISNIKNLPLSIGDGIKVNVSNTIKGQEI